MYGFWHLATETMSTHHSKHTRKTSLSILAWKMRKPSPIRGKRGPVISWRIDRPAKIPWPPSNLHWGISTKRFHLLWNLLQHRQQRHPTTRLYLNLHRRGNSQGYCCWRRPTQRQTQRDLHRQCKCPSSTWIWNYPRHEHLTTLQYTEFTPNQTQVTWQNKCTVRWKN